MKPLNAAVHSTAIVDPGADIADDVQIGPYAIVGPGVTIGSGTRVAAHAVIERDTTIGERCEIHYGAVIGGDPQDLKYEGESTTCTIGNGNCTFIPQAPHRTMFSSGTVLRIRFIYARRLIG